MIGTGLPAPTRAESLRMDLIVEGGCICCDAYAELLCACEVHHLTTGGKHGQLRLGHTFTVGICPWHHRGEWPAEGCHVLGQLLLPHMVADVLGPSYAIEPSRFRRVFGGDRVLMDLQRRKLAEVADRYFPPRRGWADPPRDAPELG